MRFPSGTVDQFIYFFAADAGDFVTPETGLSSFTVYRSRNGAAAAVYTTPTINETSSANMPGVYELLLDEDMTIDSGDDSQDVILRITHAGMAPVSLKYELYRPKITAGETLTATAGKVDGVALVDTVTTYTGNTPQTADVATLNNISVNDILTTQMTESYATNGVAPTFAQAQFAIHQMLMQFGISGTSITVRKLDDVTTAFVVTLDDANRPTDAKRI